MSSYTNRGRKSSWFTKIDIFGFEFNFLLGQDEKYQTTLGAFLTIGYVFTFIALFFGFGTELYQRKYPKVSFNSLEGNYSDVKLSNQNFTYAYRIEDVNGKVIENESIIYPEVNYFTYRMENEEWSMKRMEIIKNKKCREINSISEKEIIHNISLKNWYCIDFDNVTMGGYWDGNFVEGIMISTKQCKNSTERKCASQEEIVGLFENGNSASNLYYSDLSLELMPMMSNYDKPLQTVLKNRYEMLNLNMTKNRVQNFKITYIENDRGWFFNDVEESHIISSEGTTSDFTFKDQWTKDIVFSQNIYFTRKYDKYLRSYTKIQEVFATIGGFSRFFFSLISFFLICINRINRVLYVINNVPFHFTDSDFKNDIDFRFSRIKNEIKNKKYILKDCDKKINSNDVKCKNKPDNVEGTKETDASNISLSNYLYYFCKKGKQIILRKRKKLNNYLLYAKYYLKVMNVVTFFDFYNEFQKLKKLLIKHDERFIFERMTTNELEELSIKEASVMDYEKRKDLNKFKHET